VNEEHLRLCASPEWAETVATQILPWTLEGVELGERLLEVGPGPGRTTDVLRHKVRQLTAVEADPALAAALASRLAGTNVAVVHADATALPFEDGRFSAAASFTMLHHVPSAALQDRLLAEVARVLRPGGVLVGVDSLDRPPWRDLHRGDVCVPVDPTTFPDRLRRAGFVDVDVQLADTRFRFAARTAPTDATARAP
jgi:SAM-dependent methyltransferase